MIQLLLIAGLLAPQLEGAEAAPGASVTAQEIIDRATDRTALGFDSGQATVRMVLQDKEGARKSRKIQAKSLATEGGERRTLIRFMDPPDVRGSAFLLLEGAKPGPNDMFLYLPALKRTRRVAGAQKTGPFMGSDFTFADMESRDLKAARYERMPDAQIDGVPCHHVKALPKDDAQYSRVELWARASDFLPQQIKFFGPDGALSKVYRLHEAKEVDGLKVVTKSQMWTKATGHSTFLIVDTIDREAPLSVSDFTPQSLATP